MIESAALHRTSVVLPSPSRSLTSVTAFTLYDVLQVYFISSVDVYRLLVHDCVDVPSRTRTLMNR